MALFRVDFSGRGELADRQQKLAQMLSRLQKISEGEHVCLCMWVCHLYVSVCVALFSLYIEYNVAVFITNQMTADPGGTYGVLCVCVCVCVDYIVLTIPLSLYPHHSQHIGTLTATMRCVCVCFRLLFMVTILYCVTQFSS